MSKNHRLLPVVIALGMALTALLVPTNPATAVANGTIKGTLTGDGSIIDGQETVQAFKVPAPDLYPATDEFAGTSSYSLSLPPGDYYLHFAGSGFASEWWNDSPTRQNSTPITVTSGGTITADADLGPGGSIAGFVSTDYMHEGIRDTRVDAYQQDSTYAGGWVRLTSTSVSGQASDGKYAFNYLPSGNYRLHFYSEITHYEGWWPSATTLESAESIPLTAPAALTGLDPTLSKAGTISGKVTVASSGAPVSNVYVTLFWNNHGNWGFTQYATTTKPDGTYTLYAPADTYRVEFSPDLATKLRKEYWNNHSTVSVADNVVLNVATDTTGISARLEKNLFHLTSAAAITGTYKVGYTLKAVPPKSTPTSTTTTYQWLRDGKPISGTAAKKSYWKLVTADRHHKIGVKITLNRFGYVPIYRIVTKSTNLP